MELAECSLFQLLHEPIDTDKVKFNLESAAAARSDTDRQSGGAFLAGEAESGCGMCAVDRAPP
jgi:hypothetical protein